MRDEPQRVVGSCLGSGAGGTVGFLLGIGVAVLILDAQKTDNVLDLLNLFLLVPVILAVGAGLGGILGSGIGAAFGRRAAAKSDDGGQSYPALTLAKTENNTYEPIDAEISRLKSKIAELELQKEHAAASIKNRSVSNENTHTCHQANSSSAVKMEPTDPVVVESQPLADAQAKELEALTSGCCPECGAKLDRSIELGEVVTKCVNCGWYK